MARTISPSNDQVQTVYSAGGFAAGDYVFRTSTGFEKCTTNIQFPVLTNATIFQANLNNIGFGFAAGADYLLGPSQPAGTHTGSAITAGSANLANTALSGASGFSFYAVCRLSNGDWLVVTPRTGYTGVTVRVYDASFSSLRTTLTNSVPTYSCKLLPDNSNGAAILLGDGSNFSKYLYLAETSPFSYGLSSVVINPAGNQTFQNNTPTAVLVSDGLIATGCYDYATGQLRQFKISYTPRSTNTPSVTYNNSVSSSPTNPNYGQFAITVPTALSGSSNRAVMYCNWITSGNSFYNFVIDQSPTTPNGGSNITTVTAATSGVDSTTHSWGLGVAIKSAWNSNGCSVLAPLWARSSNTLYFQITAFNTNFSAINTSTSSAFTMPSNFLNDVNTCRNVALYAISDPTVNDPILLLTYIRVNGSYASPYARIVSPSGTYPNFTLGTEFALNSSTPTGNNYWGQLTYYDFFSNNVLGAVPTGATTGTVQGTHGAALSSPQPFTYLTSLSPAATGTCVGVALTSASAGGTGKILIRGTAEVRSGLPNAPAALSFNHANYAPGGIKGTVTGRTVTFEGIDG